MLCFVQQRTTAIMSRHRASSLLGARPVHPVPTPPAPDFEDITQDVPLPSYAELWAQLQESRARVLRVIDSRRNRLDRAEARAESYRAELAALRASAPPALPAAPLAAPPVVPLAAPPVAPSAASLSARVRATSLARSFERLDLGLAFVAAQLR